MPEYTLEVLPQDAGKRLDVFLMDFSHDRKLGLSRTAIQKLIAGKNVSLSSEGKVKPNYKVKPGDKFKLSIAEKIESGLLPENLLFEVIYEDKDLAVINKPAGLVVHPAPGNPVHTLVNALLYRFKELSNINPTRPGIVHRLDKETSGVLVVAKNNTSHLVLAKQFSEHSIKRKYIALVEGKVEFDEGEIEIPVGRHPIKRKSMSAGFREDAKYAKTYYHTLKRSVKYSVLELEPFTGRTHQLRVHLKFLGHPILGDSKYGRSDSFTRLALHARYLGFIHPASGKFVEFSSGLPKEFKVMMK